MRKLFISAGHESYKNTDLGAIANGVNEADLTSEFCTLLNDKLTAIGLSCIREKEDDNLIQIIEEVKLSMEANDIAIDIHFNASDPKAYGTEIFVPEKYSKFEFEVASKLLSVTTSVLQTFSRGVKTESQSNHSRLGFFKPNCETILIEICFITNSSDLFKYQNNKETLALNIAVALSKLILL